MRLRNLQQVEARLKRLRAYEATGLEPEEVAAMAARPLPTNDDYAPLPMLSGQEGRDDQ